LLEASLSDHTAYFGVQANLFNPCAGSVDCLPDGQCTDKGKASSCCTERLHKTLDCGKGRCGCLIDGACALSKDDCCSGTSHGTLACAGGLSVRCGPKSEFDNSTVV